jgi:hypothetical protein
LVAQAFQPVQAQAKACGYKNRPVNTNGNKHRRNACATFLFTQNQKPKTQNRLLGLATAAGAEALEVGVF